MNVMRLFGRSRPTPPERRLYEAIVAAARHPRLYDAYDVPDTIEGRFDMIILHAFLVLERLRGAPRAAQALVDEMFRDMDRSLREMGASDPAVPKKVRRMAEAYQGRVRAYHEGLANGELAQALRRNVYAGAAGPVARLEAYVRENRKALSRADIAQIARGECAFAEPAP